MFLPICGQEMSNWQEQILQQVDIEDLSDEAYATLIEELSDLTVWSDTTQHSPFEGKLRQHIIWSSNRCLNTRDGYLNATPDRKETNEAYLGDPWHHSLRYGARYGKHWQIGFNLEKDAGEAWRSSFPMFDSWHAFVRARNLSINQRMKISDVVVGHYRLRMSCGLVLNQGFSLGKQYISDQLFNQRSNMLMPFASNAESNYMQGVATSLSYTTSRGTMLTLLPYISARQIDGTLSSNHILTALQSDGYHRTKTEERHHHAAWQWISGSRVGYRGEWYDIGLHLSYTHLQYDYLRSNLYYNKHFFRGHQLFQSSIDYTFHALNCWLRGEIAFDDQAHPASITTLRFSPSDTWTVSLLHRYYSPQYHQLHASALRESSSMQGEQGLTLNITSQISRHWGISSMLDYFHFSQPQYGIRDSISNGFEGLLKLNYANHISLTYRIKQKAETFRHTFDATLSFQPLSSLSCKTQLRSRIYNKKGNGDNTSLGYLAAQSFTYQDRHWQHVPFQIDAQACYFKTDDYDARLYLSERPLLYAFSIPMLYGEGLRYTLTSTIKIGPSLSLDLKYALTNYANRSAISSGLQRIASNTQQDLWLQCRFNL